MNHPQIRRKLIPVLLLAAIVAAVPVLLYIKYDRAFDPLPALSPRQQSVDWAERIRIGIIGDSWVAEQRLDQPVRDSLKAAGLDVEIVSAGHSGAKSRQILRDLSAPESEPYSSRRLFEDPELDYVVILAGVNDTIGHIGADFYVHHVLGMVTLFQARAVFPLVLEVPEYGIEDTPPQGAFSYAKRLLYKALFDSMKDDVIDDYRGALRTKLAGLREGTYAVVSFGPVVQDYAQSRNLYSDPGHLNQSGNRKLGEHIAKTIAAVHGKRLKSAAGPRANNVSGHN